MPLRRGTKETWMIRATLSQLFLVPFIALFLSTPSFAYTTNTAHYYGAQDQRDLSALASSPQFRSILKDILADGHFQNSYKKARTLLFGDIDLHKDSKGYYVECVYCESRYYAEDFHSRGPGPGKIPDERVLNTEHSWPQSQYNGKPGIRNNTRHPDAEYA